ncbi:MAG: dihydrolipoyl dehydrogenase family protein [Desulfonatronovibrionaceae bacterium]
MKHFDVVVIGAGPAGGACASTCARAGLKVAMVEDYGFGGTCPLRGCNPKKVLTAAAESTALVRDMLGQGLEGLVRINWEQLAAFRDSFVQGKKEKIRQAYEGMGVATFMGRAAFVDRDAVKVGHETIQGRHFVLANGMRPIELDIPGSEFLSSSDDFLALKKLPPRICFIGGGFISFEFASVAARAGAKVSIVHRSGQVLKAFDPQLSSGLAEAMKGAGVEIYLNTPITAIEYRGETLTVRAESGNKEVRVEADMVVHGAGRVPDVDDLHLEIPGVSVSRKGIEVDRHMRSVSNPDVFAAGDAAATPYALTPTGDMEGRTAAANILEPGSASADYTGVPRAVYTAPPMCAVGLLESEAREKGINFKVIQENMADWFSWTIAGQKHAACKILIDQEQDVLVGAHILGAGADELANLFAMAVRMKLPVSELQKVLWAYPTKGYYFKYMIP